jgi:hypothetical protein|uniref:Uncharacterized protein n=1 Tax=viral metagenome TaxID=1070528 RepID=A0A6C0KRC5_9ZZZZ
MDLNIENYSIEEILNILHIDVKSLENADLNQEFLYTKLQTKIAKLRNTSIDENSEISENKAQLVDFFYQCFIKVNKLLEEKQKNILIVQDDHNIIKHAEAKKEEYYPVNVKSGLINPLTIKTLKKVLNIDTRFRDNYENSSSTDFVINLPTAFKKVLSLQVINYQLPYTIYSISKKTGSHSFYVDSSLIEINDGGYDENSLVQEINSKLPSDISLVYNSLSAKFIFTSANVFSLNFDYIENPTMNYNIATNIDKNQLTLGWIMGFRNNRIIKNGKQISIKYEGSNSYESEYCYDGGLSNKYYLLSVNDYQNNHNNAFVSAFKYQTLTDNNILCKMTNSKEDGIKTVLYPKRIYFGPTNINKLHIKIYDEYGRILDVNNGDLSIEIECEILYDL